MNPSTKSCLEDDTKPNIEQISCNSEHSTPNVYKESTASSASPLPPVQQATTMTKNQIKKLARRQRMLDQRPEKRRLEKERKRLRKLELAKRRQDPSVNEVGNETVTVDTPRVKPKLMCDSDNRFKVVIDMDFEGFMTDDEIAKAAKQCKGLYAINRRCQSPCQLYMSSVKGKIRDRFAVTCGDYERWDAHISPLDYVDLLAKSTSEQTTKGHDAVHVPTDSQEARDKIRQDIIYLTGDSDELLPDASEILKDDSKIFVIGGLVDHNRHKNLCYERAKERQIRTARLPISENLKLCQRHILSTVTVFDILLNVLGERKSWRESLMAAIPRRKIHPSELDENKKDFAISG